MIIQHFSRATICDPAEGPGQFPEHTAVTDGLCARTQELFASTHELFLRALTLQNSTYVHRGDYYSPVLYVLIHLSS